MKKISRLVFTAMLDYEQAILDALLTLDGTDDGGQMAAFERVVKTLAAFHGMSKGDRESALMCLLRRGRISEEAWDRVAIAMQYLASGADLHPARSHVVH